MKWFGFKLPKQKTLLFVLGVAVLLFIILLVKSTVSEGFQTPCPSGYTLYTTMIGGVSMNKCQSAAKSIAWGGGGGNPAASIPAIPAICRGLGTAQPSGAFKNMMLYSQAECNALGGTWNDDTAAATALGGSTRVGQCMGPEGGYTWNCRGLSAPPPTATQPAATSPTAACPFNSTRSGSECRCNNGYSNINTGADKLYNPTCKAVVQCYGGGGYNLAYTDTTSTACKCAPNSFPSITEPTTGVILACTQCPTGTTGSIDGTTCVCSNANQGFSKKQMACVSCPSMYVMDSTKTNCNLASQAEWTATAQDGVNKLVCDTKGDSTNGGTGIKDQGNAYSGSPIGANGHSYTCCPSYSGCKDPTVSGGRCQYEKYNWSSTCNPKNRNYNPNKYSNSISIITMPANYNGKM